MPYFLSPIGNSQIIDANGDPLVGGTIETYLAGTSTPETTYTSSTGGTPQGVVMTLNSLGLPTLGPVWMLGGVALKFIIKNALGVVQGPTYDNITGVGESDGAIDQWVLYGATPTYISATSFSVAGDQTNTFQVNRRLKSINSGGTIYSRISASAFSAGVTTVTVVNDSGVLDSGMSQVSYGLLSATNPSIPETATGALYRTAATLLPFRGYFNGFPLSTAGASATITIGAGQAADNTNAQILSLSSALAKTTSAWAVGSGNGGLDEGTIATSAWYATYIIRRADTGVTDALLSKSSGNTGTATITIASPGVVTWTAHGQQVGSGIVFSTTGALPTGLVAGTRYYVIAAGLTTNAFQVSATIGGAAINTSGTQSGVHTVSAPPLLPANYGYYVYAGSNKTDGSSQWVKGIQNGNLVTLDVAVRDVNQNNPGTSAITQALASVPLGVKVKARILAGVINTGGGDTALITDLDTTAAAPVLGNVPGVTLVSTGAAYAYAEKTIVTNTSQSVRYQVSGGTATTTIHFITTGWEYIR